MPLSEIITRSQDATAPANSPAFLQRGWQCLNPGSFEATLSLKLVPLDVVKARSKLVTAEISGTEKPTVLLPGHVVVNMRLKLSREPARLWFSPHTEPEFVLANPAQKVGHAGDPVGVLKAVALAAQRL